MIEVGFFRLSLAWQQASHTVAVAESRLVRPPVARRFVGQTPESVVEWVGLLYGVCRTAQQLAAEVVLTAATGRQVTVLPARVSEVWKEAAREHLIHLLHRWPEVSGESPQWHLWHEWRDVESSDETHRRRWVESCLVPVIAPYLAHWEKAAPRIGARLRCRWQRIVHDLVLPAEALVEWLALSIRQEAGEAEVALTTARGKLIHRARVCDDRVACYAVDAPTDRLCFDAAVVRELIEPVACSRREEVVELGRAALAALDPCVPCELEVRDA